MGDSEQDEMYEDAQDGGEEQPKKTRKTAGGRVVIKSKEGEMYSDFHQLYSAPRRLMPTCCAAR